VENLLYLDLKFYSIKNLLMIFYNIKINHKVYIILSKQLYLMLYPYLNYYFDK